jgi:hypothetical protein
MPVLGKIALAVVGCGVALGTMLGAAANPVMKMAAERPWQGAFDSQVTPDPGYLSAGYIAIEAPPQDLSPYQDSYAPTWAREELTNWEPEYPAWTYGDLVDERLADTSAAEEASIDAQQVASAAEEAAAPHISPEPVEPADLASGPSKPASYARQASHLADIY